MTARQTSAVLLARDEIVAPPAARACQDRTFEIPTVLYLATAALFLAFVGVLSFAFRSPEMAVPFGVFVAFILAFFTVPALWTRITPEENMSKALGWNELLDKGIETGTGHATGREAAVLVLLLPSAVMGWAVAIATIAWVI